MGIEERRSLSPIKEGQIKGASSFSGQREYNKNTGNIPSF